MNEDSSAVATMTAYTAAVVFWCAHVTSVHAEIGCGPRCVSVAARVVDRPIEEAALRAAFGDVAGVHSLEELQAACEKLGLSSRLCRLSDVGHVLNAAPVIAAVRRQPESDGPDHFVVLYGRKDGGIQVIDFPNRPRWTRHDDVMCDSIDLGLVLAGNETQLDHLAITMSRSVKPWQILIGLAIIGIALGGLLFARQGQEPGVSGHE